MSTYLEMWALIHESTPKERQSCIDTYTPARGRDIPFKGHLFFDVDLLEALRNAEQRVGSQVDSYRKRTVIYRVTDDSKLFTDMSIAMEKTLRELNCEPVWSRDESIEKSDIPKH